MVTSTHPQEILPYKRSGWIHLCLKITLIELCFFQGTWGGMLAQYTESNNLALHVQYDTRDSAQLLSHSNALHLICQSCMFSFSFVFAPKGLFASQKSLWQCILVLKIQHASQHKLQSVNVWIRWTMSTSAAFLSAAVHSFVRRNRSNQVGCLLALGAILPPNIKEGQTVKKENKLK